MGLLTWMPWKQTHRPKVHLSHGMGRYVVIAIKTGIPPLPDGTDLPLVMARCVAISVEAPNRIMAARVAKREIEEGPLHELGEHRYVVMSKSEYYALRVA